MASSRWISMSSQRQRERTAEMVCEYRDVGLERLQELARSARSCPREWPGVALVDEAVDRLSRDIEIGAAVDAEPRRRDETIVRLRRCVTDLESGIDQLWRSLVESFCADLSRVVADTLVTNREDLERFGIAVEADTVLRNDELQVHVDPGELAYAVDNLIQNAIRAMRGSSRRQLRISAQANSDHIELEVADTGCGIEDTRIRDIWAEGAGPTPGRARGLPRSRSMMARFGGTLQLASTEPGQGSVFRIALLKPIGRILK